MFNQQRCHKIFRKKRFGAAQIESVRLNSLRLRPIFRQSFCGKSGSHVIATGNNGHHVEPPPLCGTIVNFLYLHELQLDGKLRAREPRKRDRSLFMSRTRKKGGKITTHSQFSFILPFSQVPSRDGSRLPADTNACSICLCLVTSKATTCAVNYEERGNNHETMIVPVPSQWPSVLASPSDRHLVWTRRTLSTYNGLEAHSSFYHK